MAKRRRYQSSKKVTNTMTKVMTFILVILAILLLVGGVTYYYRSTLITVTYQGEEFKGQSDRVLELERNTDYRFDVGFDKGFKVSIIQAMTDPSDDFSYYVNEQITTFKNETILTKGFNIVKDDTGIILNIDKGLDEVLSAVHGEDIELEDTDYLGQYFAIYFTDMTGKKFCRLLIQVNMNPNVKSIELDKGNIIL